MAIKKAQTLLKVGKVNTVLKYGSMITAICGFARKAKVVPVVGTAICFTSVVVDTVIGLALVNEIVNSDDEDDVLDDNDVNGEEDKLCSIADEYGDTEEPTDEDFAE